MHLRKFIRRLASATLICSVFALSACGSGKQATDKDAVLSSSSAPTLPPERLATDLRALGALDGCSGDSLQEQQEGNALNAGISQINDEIMPLVNAATTDDERDRLMQYLGSRQDLMKRTHDTADLDNDLDQACRTLANGYHDLSPHLSSHSELRAIVDKCSDTASLIIKMKSWRGDGPIPAQWTEVIPTISTCPAKIRAAAGAIGISLDRPPRSTAEATNSAGAIPLQAMAPEKQDMAQEGAEDTPSSLEASARPAAQTIVQKEQPLGRPWITDEDFAGKATPGQTWSTVVDFQVWEDGRAHGCTATDQQGSLGAFVCSLIEQRARYKPAVGSNGELIRTQDEMKYGWD